MKTTILYRCSFGISRFEIVFSGGVDACTSCHGSLPEPDTDLYGKTYLNLESEGVETAQKYRYVSSLVTTGATENLNYTSNTPVGGDNYLRVTDQKLKVEQGQKVTVKFAGRVNGSDDGLKWCLGKACRLESRLCIRC